jgi:hypothetical protein
MEYTLPKEGSMPKQQKAKHVKVVRPNAAAKSRPQPSLSSR